MEKPGNKQQDEFRTAVIMTVVWVAGLTLTVIFVALFAGIFLDRYLNSKPLFTILLTIASIPVTIYATFRIFRAATKRISPSEKNEIPQEKSRREEND